MDCCEILAYVIVWNLALTTAVLRMWGLKFNGKKEI